MLEVHLDLPAGLRCGRTRDRGRHLLGLHRPGREPRTRCFARIARKAGLSARQDHRPQPGGRVFSLQQRARLPVVQRRPDLHARGLGPHRDHRRQPGPHPRRHQAGVPGRQAAGRLVPRAVVRADPDPDHAGARRVRAVSPRRVFSATPTSRTATWAARTARPHASGTHWPARWPSSSPSRPWGCSCIIGFYFDQGGVRRARSVGHDCPHDRRPGVQETWAATSSCACRTATTGRARPTSGATRAPTAAARSSVTA